MTAEERYQMHGIAEEHDLVGRPLEVYLFLCEVIVDFPRGYKKALALLDGANLPAKQREQVRCALEVMDLWVTELYQPADEASAEDIARYTRGDAS